MPNTCVALRGCVVDSMDSASKPTVPSTVGDEKRINPFMRVHAAAVQAFAGVDVAATGGADTEASGAAVIGAVRAKKNAFK